MIHGFCCATHKHGNRRVLVVWGGAAVTQARRYRPRLSYRLRLFSHLSEWSLQPKWHLSWRWLDVVASIWARFSKFAFALFCSITNHLMTGLSGNKIHCSPRDHSLIMLVCLLNECLISNCFKLTGQDSFEKVLFTFLVGYLIQNCDVNQRFFEQS